MAFTFKLEHEDGRPADPPVLNTAVPNWSAGDTIPLSAERALRVVEIRASTADEDPVLVVESAQSGSELHARLAEVIDVHELERRMRPGALSSVGFLGEDERLEKVLEADRLTLTELGLTPGQISEPLERLLGAADIFLLEADHEEHRVPESLREKARAAVDATEEIFGRVVIKGGPLFRVLVGGRFQVTRVSYAGIQECPWSQDVLTPAPKSQGTLRLCGAGSADWSIRDVQRGLEMKGPSLITHLIRDHGFFEGFGSPYRVDPRALAELLQLGPFAEPT